MDILVIVLAFYFMAEVIDQLFIKSLDNIAHNLRLSQSVSGATLLAFGTSAPEIATALFALFLTNATPATGVGTIVGSAIFQILVVIGFACIANRNRLNWKPIIRDSIFYIFSVILLLVFIEDDHFSLEESIVLVGCYALYLLFLSVWMRFIDKEESQPTSTASLTDTLPRRRWWRTLLNILTAPVRLLIRLIPDPSRYRQWTYPVFFLCLGIIAISSYFMVLAAEHLSMQLGIPPAIIALTILAGGTSMPEIIASYIVAKQGRGDMAIANAIGSNIFDILMSLGLPVLIYTLWQGDIKGLGGANIFSSVILLFASLLIVLMAFLVARFRATRLLGVLLIGLYVLYVWAAYSGWLE